jgi:hypothetical protein
LILCAGIWTREGPKSTSEFVLRAPNSGWWCKEDTRGFILVWAKEDPTSSGKRWVVYFLAPKCLYRGYKSWERDPVPSLKERVQWSIAWDVNLRSGEMSVTEPPNYTRLSRKIIQREDNLTNLSPYNPIVHEISTDFKPFHITAKIVLSLAVTIISYIKVRGIKYIRV